MSNSVSRFFNRLPVFWKVGLYLAVNYGLLFAAQLFTGFLRIGDPLTNNIFLCVLLIVFTGVVLRWERLSWKGIGCSVREKKGFCEWVTGTLAGMVMLLAVAFIIRLATGFHWERNPGFHFGNILTIIITVFASVMAQELAFRGYPFYILLKSWGEWPAQLFLAVLFGCMHLSHGMTLPEIALVMLTTGVGSLLFGIAVIRTGRLHLAIGLHFGWNLLQYLLPRANEQNGEGIWLVKGGETGPSGGMLIWILPYLIVVVSAFLIIRFAGRRRPVQGAN